MTDRPYRKNDYVYANLKLQEGEYPVSNINEMLICNHQAGPSNKKIDFQSGYPSINHSRSISLKDIKSMIINEHSNSKISSTPRKVRNIVFGVTSPMGSFNKVIESDSSNGELKQKKMKRNLILSHIKPNEKYKVRMPQTDSNQLNAEAKVPQSTFYNKELVSGTDFIIPVNPRLRKLMEGGTVLSPISTKINLARKRTEKVSDNTPTNENLVANNFNKSCEKTTFDLPSFILMSPTLKSKTSIMNTISPTSNSSRYRTRFNRTSKMGQTQNKRLPLSFEPELKYLELQDTLRLLTNAGCDDTALFSILCSEFGSESLLVKLIFDKYHKMRKTNSHNFVHFLVFKNNTILKEEYSHHLKLQKVQQTGVRTKRDLQSPYKDIGEVNVDGEGELDRIPYLIDFLRSKLRGFEEEKAERKVKECIELQSKIYELIKDKKTKEFLGFQTSYDKQFKPNMEPLKKAESKHFEKPLPITRSLAKKILQYNSTLPFKASPKKSKSIPISPLRRSTYKKTSVILSGVPNRYPQRPRDEYNPIDISSNNIWYNTGNRISTIISYEE